MSQCTVCAYCMPMVVKSYAGTIHNMYSGICPKFSDLTDNHDIKYYSLYWPGHMYKNQKPKWKSRSALIPGQSRPKTRSVNRTKWCIL